MRAPWVDGGRRRPARRRGSEQAAAAGQPAAQADEALPLTLENIYKRGRGGASNPTISPDGNWVTFAARTGQGPGNRSVAIEGRRRWRAGFLGRGSETVWAPDSQSVVFARGDRLWKLGVNEKEATAITPAVKGMRGPVFSPDGRTIAFSATASGHQDVWLVPAAGGGARAS